MNVVAPQSDHIIARQCDPDTARIRFDAHQATVDIDEVEGQRRFEKLASLYKRKAPLMARVRAVHQLVDWYMAEIRVDELSVCQRGCSHCCRIPVEVCRDEAEYISRTSKVPMSPGKITDAEKNDYCVFLRNNECSIYENRPVACRTFVTIDSPYYCEHDMKHTHIGAHGLPPILHVMGMMTAACKFKFRDIREWFKTQK